MVLGGLGVLLCLVSITCEQSTMSNQSTQSYLMILIPDSICAGLGDLPIVRAGAHDQCRAPTTEVKALIL